MQNTIARVEKRYEELDDASQEDAVEPTHKPGYKVIYPPLQDAPGSTKDRLFHQTYEVPCEPICQLDLAPELVSTDASSISSRSQEDSIIHLKDPLPITSCNASNSAVHPVQATTSSSSLSLSILFLAWKYL